MGQVGQLLSQMNGVKTQQEFVAACIRGLTANYQNDKNVMINSIFDKFKDKCPVSAKEALILYAEGKVFRTYSTLPS